MAVLRRFLLYQFELYDSCFVAETCAQLDNCLQFVSNPLAIGPGGIGLILIGFAIHGVIAMILLVLIESGVFRNMWNKLTITTVLDAKGSDAQEDEDVATERIAVKHIFQVIGAESIVQLKCRLKIIHSYLVRLIYISHSLANEYDDLSHPK